MLEKLTHFRHDVNHVSFPLEAVLQSAIQFAYDFVLHAACPLSYSYFAPACLLYLELCKQAAHRGIPHVDVSIGSKDVVG
jgi:hypothetical protein